MRPASFVKHEVISIRTIAESALRNDVLHAVPCRIEIQVSRLERYELASTAGIGPPLRRAASGAPDTECGFQILKGRGIQSLPPSGVNIWEFRRWFVGIRKMNSGPAANFPAVALQVADLLIGRGSVDIPVDDS